MSTIDQEIEMMTEETANEMIKAFEDMNRASMEFSSLFPTMMHNYAANLVLVASKKQLYYTERYVKAWPVTRWWWKRKLDKANMSVEKAKECYDKMKSEGLFEPIKIQ